MGRKKIYQNEEERKAAKAARNKRWYEKNKAEKAAYYQDHKEEKSAYHKQYYQDHKAERAAYYQEHMAEFAAKNKQYYADHKDEHAAYMKQWYEANKEESAAYKKQYYATKLGRAVNLASNYRKQDKDAGRDECTIDAQWIMDNVFSGQVCHYCGESDWTKLGCDRIDNTKPHTPDNVVCCCGKCNNKKGTTPYDEYLKKVS